MELTVTGARMVLAGTTKQIRIRLSNEAIAALRSLAAREYRDPRQQAEYILETVLLGQDDDDGPAEAETTTG